MPKKYFLLVGNCTLPKKDIILGKISIDETIQILMKALEDSHIYIRRSAVSALADRVRDWTRFESSLKNQILKSLIICAKDEDYVVRNNSVRALGAIVTQNLKLDRTDDINSQLIRTLFAASNDDNEIVYKSVQVILNQIEQYKVSLDDFTTNKIIEDFLNILELDKPPR